MDVVPAGEARTWAVAAGGALVALSSVGLLPMIDEGLAVRSARARFDVERLNPVSADEREAAFQCGPTRVVLSRDSTHHGSAAGQVGRRTVGVRIGDTLLRTAVPVALNETAGGASWYWNRIVPFRGTDRVSGARECGVAYRLPSDSAAVRRARRDRPSGEVGFLLERIRGVRAPYMHGWRFHVIRWDHGGGALEQREFAYPDWDGDPYATLVLNLLGSPVGIRNQSLSSWPSLLWPVLYPFGLGLLGIVLVFAGLVARHRP